MTRRGSAGAVPAGNLVSRAGGGVDLVLHVTRRLSRMSALGGVLSEFCVVPAYGGVCRVGRAFVSAVRRSSRVGAVDSFDVGVIYHLGRCVCHRGGGLYHLNAWEGLRCGGHQLVSSVGHLLDGLVFFQENGSDGFGQSAQETVAYEDAVPVVGWEDGLDLGEELGWLLISEGGED